ncbi:hypothetical protein WN943_000825 [Citrus x changshan-huyou]
MSVKRGKEDKLVVFIMYVDDIILPGNDRDEIKRLKMLLTKEFETKYLDITFAAGDISQFMHSPNVEYMKAMFRILKYLKTSRGNDILISKNNHLRIEAYTNADWAGSFVDKKSTSRPQVGREEKCLEGVEVSPESSMIPSMGSEGYILLVSSATKKLTGTIRSY